MSVILAYFPSAVISDPSQRGNQKALPVSALVYGNLSKRQILIFFLYSVES